jgi:hypothetical protein
MFLMKFEKIVLTAPLATLLFFSAGWAEQAPNTQSPPENSTKNAKNGSKEKHWSGILVDVSCMAKNLGAENKADPPAEPAIGVAHLIGWGAALPEPDQVPGSGGPGATPGSAQRGPEAGLPTEPPMTDEAAARANKVDNAAKVCFASLSAQALGLATSDGQVLQFDEEGNAKAKEALKDADLDPGKKVKAKVTGTMKDETTVIVASIDIKGSGKRASPGAANQDV